MKHTVNLPDIGEGVVEGEVIEWLKKPGDAISQDEPVVSVMTDKATVELSAPKSGKLLKQHYQAGEIALVGNPLYELEVAGEEEEPAEKEEKKKTPEPKAKAPKKQPTPQPRSPGQKALATPHIRHVAKELGVDLNQVTGTGKEGRVTAADLKGIPTSKSIEPLPGDRAEPVIGIFRRMAETMAEAKRTIPHFTYTEQVEATRLVLLCQKLKEQAAPEGIHITYMPFFIRALSLTLKQFPKINSSYDAANEQILYHEQQNIGIAMSTGQGLIVPVLKNVQEMHLEEIIRSFEELKKRTQDNQLKSADMKGATISITNFGVLGGGGRWATPIITPPESAILGVARIQKTPVVRGSQMMIQDTLNLSWSFDHRIIDGDLAAQVSHYFATLIQNPAPLL